MFASSIMSAISPIAIGLRFNSSLRMSSTADFESQPKFAGWVADTDCTDCATGVRSVVGRVNVAVFAPRDEPSGSQALGF